MGESFFRMEGDATWFELEVLLNAGEEVPFFGGGGLFVIGVGKYFSSFKDRTSIILFRESFFRVLSKPLQFRETNFIWAPHLGFALL